MDLPYIIFVFHHSISRSINDRYNIPLQVVGVAAHLAVMLHNSRSALCIVEEMKFFDGFFTLPIYYSLGWMGLK